MSLRRQFARLLPALALEGPLPAFADNDLFRYDPKDLAPTTRQWTGSPGPVWRLPHDALILDGAVALSGRGASPALSPPGPAPLHLLPAREMTVEAVVAVEDPGEWGGFVGFLQDNGGEETGWVLGHHRRRFAFAVSTKGADDGNGRMTYLEAPRDFTPGRLYHVAGVFDGAEQRLYIDGQSAGASAVQKGDILYPSRSALVIGGYRDADENYPLRGRLAFVRVVDRALAAEAIARACERWRDRLDAPPLITAAMPRPAPSLTGPRSAGAQPDGSVELPVHQTLTPAGAQVLLPGLRPQAVTTTADGRRVLVTGRSAELLVLDPRTAAVVEKIPMPAGSIAAPPASADHILATDPKAQVSFTGLAGSPDRSWLALSNVGGSIKLFKTDPGGLPRPSHSLALPEVQGLRRKQEIPAGLAFSADGTRLYVAANLSNQLLELETASGRVLRAIAVGVAPYEVRLAGGKAFVSNWGGRRPAADSPTHEAGRGTRVRVDARSVASEGSVSVVDLASGTVLREILTGRHACALALHPSGRHLVVANANEDTLSVIDTKTDEVVETLSLAWQPRGLPGASPNALAFDAGGKRLFVCLGTQNAVAVVAFKPGASAVSGLIPVGWYPAAVAVLGDGRLAIANLKGIGSGGHGQLEGQASFNSHQHTGSVTLVDPPEGQALAQATAAVMRNTRKETLDRVFLPPRPGTPPRPVPERVGEPSTIRHVVYIIKENRTYDQVLGDLPQGRGDPFLCVFGEEVTPNQHRLAREFVLLDNTHCCGVLSADGHQWSTTGYVTDYLEKSFAGFPRSYPDLCGIEDHDGLAYSPGGFLWDAALARGLSVRNFGESSKFNEARWTDPARKDRPGYRDCVADWRDGAGLIQYRTAAGLPSLEAHTCTNTVGWLTHVPDVVRAEAFLRELGEWEKTGAMPALCVMALPQDHTNGTGAGEPTPAACVADNDLAVGRVVEGLSKSRFWKECAVFIIEDDPQNGWDHVSPYRTTAYVAGPWVRRGAVVSELYSQTSMLRTMELILGLPPMNQLDAIATPMTACFTDTPDFTPFTSVPNRIPLDEMNPKVSDLRDPLLRKDALVSARLPLHKVDACPEDVFNRILWRNRKGSAVPYPEWAILPADRREDDDDDDDDG